MDLLTPTFFLLLSITGCCVGQDVLPDGPVDAILGKNVTLTLLYTKQADDEIIWNYSNGSDLIKVVTFRKGRVIVSDRFKDRASLNTTNGYLTLSSLKATDSGDYSIIVLKADDEATGEIKLRVLEPVSNVVIKSEPAEAVERNTTVILTCTAKGSFLNFAWFNNTTPIKIDGVRVIEKKDELSSALTFKDIFRSDLLGPIYCVVKHPLEEQKSSPFNLTVFYGPDNVIIQSTKPDLYIPSKSDFNLTCSSPSLPPATFTWYYNNQTIQATGPVLTLKTIEDQKLGGKEGDYTCRAQSTKTTRYAVSSPIRFSVMEPISGITITGPTAVLIANNGSANLSCQATAGQVIDRIWLKDGANLAAGPRVTFSNDMTSVLIYPVQKEDNGKYMCRLKNPVNQQEATYNMTVNHGPETPRLEGKGEVKVEGKTELTCSVQSVPPAQLTWKLNNTVITGKDKMTLIIEKAQYKDSGIYICEAYNAITGKRVASSPHTLSVKEEIYEGLSDGAIAGIVIGCLVAVGAAVGLFFYCQKKVPTESPY